MTLRLRHVALLIAFALPLSSLSADQNVAVKCSVNQERVWVYDSPTTFNVAAKLKCGETVVLLARENSFIRVRTANGIEGYVPTENLPMTAPTAPVPAVEANSASQPTMAGAASARTAARTASSRSSAEPVAAIATRPAHRSETSPASQPKAPSTSAPAITANSPNAVTPVSNDAATSVVAAAVPANAHSTTSASTSSHAKPKKTAKSTLAMPAKPATTSPAPAAPHSTTNPLVHASIAPPSQPGPSSTAPHGNDILVGSRPATTAAAKPAVVRNASDDSSDEEGDDNSYLIRPKSESEDPECRLFFSGYGLSPGQFKWVVDNRKKRFPAVCPAGTPAMVDYVLIFTHDVEFFNYTMPAPVHTEAGGFSDWTPLVLYDMNNVPRAEIDKSKREYVWVFHVKRGTYDPAKFSPHRRFQFTKIESRYSRTVEDAFEYIETQNVNR